MGGDGSPRPEDGRNRFFFLHLQKSAGTTLRLRMARYFGEAAVYPNGSENAKDIFYVIASVDHLLERMRVRGHEVRVIAGHYPLCTLELLGGGFRTLTVLREPVERTLSFLRQHQRNRPEDRHKSLEEIYDDPFRFNGLIHNHMTKMFSLTPDEMTDDMLTEVEFTPERLERAKENLAGVEMVGVQERFEEFCHELNDHFGWRLGDEPGFANTGGEPVAVPTTLRKRIIEDHAADIELYEFALELCDHRRNASIGRWYVPSIAESMPNADIGGAGIWQQIGALSEANRRSRDPETERRLLKLRYQAGVQLCDSPADGREDPAPDFEALENGDGTLLPEITPDQLTPGLLRAAILRHGALLVRGLVSADDCTGMKEEIDRAYQAREARAQGEPAADGYYEEFNPDPDKRPMQSRGFVKDAGVWAADSPRLMFDMLETFDHVGLRRIAREYFGEPPALSIQKCTLRKAMPDRGHSIPGWHQDGAFLGEVRALNVWLSLSHCGDDAPGLDLVPRRLDHIVPTGTEGAVFDWVVSPAMAEEVAGDLPILRPTFEAGDVMLFDELYLHATATDPAMSKVRYAVESWFFSPSAFPENYVPLAV